MKNIKFYVLNKAKKVLGENTNLDIVLEPVVKNTTPAIDLRIKYALENIASMKNVFVVLPSDYLIESEEKFLEYIKKQ